MSESEGTLFQSYLEEIRNDRLKLESLRLNGEGGGDEAMAIRARFRLLTVHAASYRKGEYRTSPEINIFNNQLEQALGISRRGVV